MLRGWAAVPVLSRPIYLSAAGEIDKDSQDRETPLYKIYASSAKTIYFELLDAVAASGYAAAVYGVSISGVLV